MYIYTHIYTYIYIYIYIYIIYIYICIYIYIYMGESRLPLSRLPVYFCFSSPSISAYLPRLQSFISPTIASHFPDYSFFASLPLLYCFISRIIVFHLLLKNIRKYIFIFFTILDFLEYLFHYLIQKLKIYCLVKK